MSTRSQTWHITTLKSCWKTIDWIGCWPEGWNQKAKRKKDKKMSAAYNLCEYRESNPGLLHQCNATTTWMAAVLHTPHPLSLPIYELG
jgi:hypothetical protein